MNTEEALQKIEGLLDGIADALNSAAIVNEQDDVADYIGDAEYAVGSVSKCIDEIAAVVLAEADLFDALMDVYRAAVRAVESGDLAELAAELRDDNLRVLMQQWHEAQETEGAP